MIKKGLELLKVLEEKGFQAFIVGGAVRDTLLGKDPKDIDICTNALPEEVMNIFPEHYPSGLKFGTVTVFFKDYEFEITTFRSDGKYLNGRKPEAVYFSNNLEEDLSRRDLTINSLAMNSKGETIDIFNGVSDLDNRVIKAVGNPAKRFEEDALRILRVFRFSAVLNFDIDKETLIGISKTKENLKTISKERIREELTKILLSGNVNKTMHQMYEMGIFDVILTELRLLFGVNQNNPYHCFNVATHTFMSVESIDNDAVLKMTMLLHDIGKFETKETKEGKDIFYNHHKVSLKIAEKFLKDLAFSKRKTFKILELIKFHDREIVQNKKAVRRIKNKLKHNSFEELLLVKKADVLSQNPDFLYRLKYLDSLYELSKESKKIEIKDLSVDGYDLMKIGLQGKEIGEGLRKLLKIVIDNPKLNEKEILLKTLEK